MTKKNIYGTELKKCNTNQNYYINDSSINGYCNESSIGYHNKFDAYNELLRQCPKINR